MTATRSSDLATCPVDLPGPTNLPPRRLTRLLPPAFNPPSPPIRILRRIGSEGTPRAVGIVQRLRRVGGAVAAIAIAGGIGIVGIGAELAAIVPLLIVEPGRVGGIGIGGRLVAEPAAVGAEGIVDAVGIEAANG